MSEAHSEALRTLLRRVDEVRGLSDRSASAAPVGLDDTETLLRTLSELVEELERSHRRLIETNVQLVSLREVGGSLTSTVDIAETTRTVTRYLQRAFGFDHVCLMIIDLERGVMAGAWTGGIPGAESSEALEIPLVGERGALGRTVWLNRTLLHQDCRRHPPAFVAESHALFERFQNVGSMVSVPLQRSPSGLPSGGCENCQLGDSSMLVPPPGPGAATWYADLDAAQKRCLACDRLPSLGVIAIARSAGSPPLTAADVTLVESIALSVAPMVENAKLFQELRRSERFQQDILDSIVSSLVAVNLRGEVLSLNRAAQELLGWSEAEAVMLGAGDVLGQEADAIIRDTLERGEEIQRQEALLRVRDGSVVPVRLTTSRLRDGSDNVYGAIATFLDLTPIKRAEENARQLDRLAALGRFTSSVAHEIRNPLTGIGMGVQHLSRAIGEDPAERKNVEFIQSEIKRLDRIVQELFDVTHPRRLELRPHSLVETARRAHQSLEPMLAERGLEVSFAAPQGLPDVPHDEDQLQQVFINLIKNAAEASPAGSCVAVAVEREGAPAGRRSPGSIVATVTDRGHGIDEATCRTLFEPFFTTKPGGTGLGLYISHDIVKRHGGNLTVHSEPGQGATFRVELPLDTEGGRS
jgi:PAS domain S-box-containing protein